MKVAALQDQGVWRTIHGAPVHIGPGGQPDMGPESVLQALADRKVPAEYKGVQIPDAKKDAILARDKGACCYCGRKVVRFNEATKTPPPWAASFDHVVPHSQGGTQHSSNLVLTCLSCNTARQERSLDWMRRYLKRERGVETTTSALTNRIRARTSRKLSDYGYNERPIAEDEG